MLNIYIYTYIELTKNPDHLVTDGITALLRAIRLDQLQGHERPSSGHQFVDMFNTGLWTEEILS